MGEISPPTAADYAWAAAGDAERQAQVAKRVADSNSGDIKYLKEWAVAVSFYLEYRSTFDRFDYQMAMDHKLKAVMMAAAPIAAGL